MPARALMAAAPILAGADTAVGPAQDGGCRGLSAAACFPRRLRRIDWAGQWVYDQACRRAAKVGWSAARLSERRDVDRVEDGVALECRLAASPGAPAPAQGGDRSLTRLAERIDALLDVSDRLEGTRT